MGETTLIVDEHMDGCELVELARGHAAVFTAKSPNRTAGQPNQDGAALIRLGGKRGVLAVADGMGGGPQGDKASRLALEAIIASVLACEKNTDDLRACILNGFEKANQDVLGLGGGAGTTLAVVEIQANAIRPYHVGDSIILSLGNRGKLKFQSVPHSPVGYAVESGLLNEKEAMYHEDRHIVSNVIGSASMTIDVGPLIPLAPRDTVLLSSDGLVDNLHLPEIVELARKGPLPEVMEGLATSCLKRMHAQNGGPSKPDDLTFIAFRPAS